MFDERVLSVADAVMYEGAFLYPYRPSALKNRRRCSVGSLAPRSASVAARAEPGWTAACLLRGPSCDTVDVLLRFLVDDGTQLQPHAVPLSAPAGVCRTEFACGDVVGALVVERTSLGEGYERVRACVLNLSACEPERERSPGPGTMVTSVTSVTRRSLHGVHLLLRAFAPAHFVSLTDPPKEAELYAAHCEGKGLWCTMMGPKRARPEVALAAPVILPDFPEIAAESSVGLCDATEIDELLALRIRTLTDAERHEARTGDPRVRELIERVESLDAGQLLGLHGARRAERCDTHELVGARVVLRPRRSADAMDVLLRGRSALVCAVQQSVDGELLLAVTVEADPGRDLGLQGLPGHRFFFGLDEVERLDSPDAGGI